MRKWVLNCGTARADTLPLPSNRSSSRGSLPQGDRVADSRPAHGLCVPEYEFRSATWHTAYSTVIHSRNIASFIGIMQAIIRALCLLAIVMPSLSRPYDPEDSSLKSVLPPGDKFEAFYPREAHGVPNGSSRPAHGHGSFYKHRNPALVDVKNAAAYGFRFDGMRRFNFDDE